MKKRIICMLVAVQCVQIGAKESDAAYIQRLFNKTKHVTVVRGGYTQTSAHISLPDVQQKIKSELSGFEKHGAILNQALERESQYKRRYDVFYTTQGCSRLLQDVMRELYIRKLGKKGALSNDAFQFMRFTFQNKKYDQFANVQDFMKYALLRDGVIFDKFDKNSILVPADISLFGSAAFPKQATWMQFVKADTSCQTEHEKKQMRDALVDLLASYGHAATYADKLLDLNKHLVDVDGNRLSDLLQIFVPESMVDANGYVSWHFGVPYDQNYIDQLLAVTNTKSNSSLDGYKHAVTHFDRIYKKNDLTAKNAVEQLLQKINSGAFKLEEYLYTLRTNPDTLKNLNVVQARLLVTNKVVLNPESGVLIYRYSQIDPAKEAAYKIDLERVLQQMDIEKHARDNIRVK